MFSKIQEIEPGRQLELAQGRFFSAQREATEHDGTALAGSGLQAGAGRARARDIDACCSHSSSKSIARYQCYT